MYKYVFAESNFKNEYLSSTEGVQKLVLCSPCYVTCTRLYSYKQRRILN
jgi:hypothetical protein